MFRQLFAPTNMIERSMRWAALRFGRSWRFEDGRGQDVTPLWIMTLGSAFWASRVLMAAIRLRLFTILGGASKTAPELAEAIGLHPRPARDFLDALVALALLHRSHGKYSNTSDAIAFLDEESEMYVGGAIAMADARLYGFWGNLTEALTSGKPQNELSRGDDQFAAIYEDRERLRLFASAMTAVSVGPAMHLARRFPWKDYRRVADIGTAAGVVPAILAASHSHLRVYGLDLPSLASVFEETMTRHGVASRAAFVGADLFANEWPKADVYILGHMLHNFDVERRRAMLQCAHESLPSGGRVIVYDAMIDDERRNRPLGLLMSLNMLIETPAGSDYTTAEARAMLMETGFDDVRTEPLAGFDIAAFGRKP